MGKLIQLKDNNGENLYPTIKQQYQVGEKYKAEYIVSNGFITSAASVLRVSVPLPKNIGDLTPNLVRLEGELRGASGYLSPGLGWHDLINLSSISTSGKENNLTLQFNKKSGTWGTNNSLASIYVRDIEIEFN